MEIINTEEQLVDKELSSLFINNVQTDKEEIVDPNMIIYNDRKVIEIENDNDSKLENLKMIFKNLEQLF